MEMGKVIGMVLLLDVLLIVGGRGVEGFVEGFLTNHQAMPKEGIVLIEGFWMLMYPVSRFS